MRRFAKFGLAGLVIATSFPMVCQERSPKTAESKSSQKDGSKGDCGIIYGDSHSFIACSPTGWQLDNIAMVDRGIYAAFYPIQSTFSDAFEHGTIFYVNTMSGSDSGRLTVEEAMKRDAKETTSQHPETVVKKLPDLPAGKEVAQVQQLVHKGNFDAIAYVQSPNVVVLFVTSSLTEDGFKKSYPAFKELVASYQYITSDVHDSATRTLQEK